ncbi:hypothetical protein [Persephonella sp.]
MKNGYLKIAEILRDVMINSKDEKIKEYAGRTAISRTYEAVFLEVYYFIEEELRLPYEVLKSNARVYYSMKIKKNIPINKHTAVGAFIALTYGENLGRLYNELRTMRNKVDYHIEIPNLIDIKTVDYYIYIGKIVLKEVLGNECC